MKKKKKTLGLIIWMCILTVMFFIMSCFMLYDNFRKTNNKNNSNNTTEYFDYEYLTKSIKDNFSNVYNYIENINYYCGNNFSDDIEKENYYISNDFTSLEDLQIYLENFFDQSLIKLDKDNYIEENNKLYCLKNEHPSFLELENQIVEIVSFEKDKVDIIIVLEYLNKDNFKEFYSKYNVSLSKIDEKWIITSYTKID